MQIDIEIETETETEKQKVKFSVPRLCYMPLRKERVSGRERITENGPTCIPDSLSFVKLIMACRIHHCTSQQVGCWISLNTRSWTISGSKHLKTERRKHHFADTHFSKSLGNC